MSLFFLKKGLNCFLVFRQSKMSWYPEIIKSANNLPLILTILKLNIFKSTRKMSTVRRKKILTLCSEGLGIQLQDGLAVAVDEESVIRSSFY